MKNILSQLVCTTIILIVCATITQAQQNAQYTQFMYSKLPQNAAYTGSKEALSIRALYRD